MSKTPSIALEDSVLSNWAQVARIDLDLKRKGGIEFSGTVVGDKVRMGWVVSFLLKIKET
jgi:hypothetical protein